MIVTKFGSATVLIEVGGLRILCDPWLTDGIYYGSWCNFPPIDVNCYDLAALDYIYVSHIHPDHFDPDTMALLDKDTPVLIHNYHSKFLKANIERLGFNVIELDNAEPFDIGNGVSFSIYAADNCDPKVCGHMFSCVSSDIKGSMQLDSLCVIDDGDHVLVNTNDCPIGISKKTLQIVKLDYPEIDFALVGYTSASLFPHCMIDYSVDDMKVGMDKARAVGLRTAVETLKIIKPRFYMPFAGTYIIGGAEYYKNAFLPSPELEETVEFVQSKLSSAGLNPSPILLNNGEAFNVKTGCVSAKYIPIDKEARSRYIEEVARNFKYNFEDDAFPSDADVLELFNLALPRLRSKQDEIGFYEDFNLLFDIPGGHFAAINLLTTQLFVIQDFSELSNWHRFKLDPRLLVRALKGPRFANWNNIEIGALLGFSRKPDVYRMDVHTLINALHV